MKSNKKNLQQTKVFNSFNIKIIRVLIYKLYVNSPEYKLEKFKHLYQPLVAVRGRLLLHQAPKLLRSVKSAWTIKPW